MKISTAKLHQVIKEELRPLVEVDTRQAPRRPRRKFKDPRHDQEDPDKTLEIPPPTERDAAHVPRLGLGDEDFVTTTSFNKHVLMTALERYADSNDLKIEPEPLGQGEYSVAYLAYGLGQNEVVKVTAWEKEASAYATVHTNREAATSEMPDAAKILPIIYDIEKIKSDPVALMPPINDRRPVEDIPKKEWTYEPAHSPDAGPMELWIIRMEKLESLDSAGYEDVQTDIFGYSGAREASPQGMIRYVENVLNFDNFYNSLEDTMNEELYERIKSADSARPKGRGKSIWFKMDQAIAHVRKQIINKIKEGTVIPVDMEKLSDEEKDPDWARAIDDEKGQPLLTVLLYNAYDAISERLVALIKDWLNNKELADDVRDHHYPLPLTSVIMKKMAAATKLPQYDPETEYGKEVYKAQAKNLSPITAPPKEKELQSKVAQIFLQRLRKLNKLGQETGDSSLEMSYGDLHSGNIMVRANGELVAADVGLFLFNRGPRGLKPNLFQESTRRFKQLAGIIRR